jgi:hypothetical protein
VDAAVFRAARFFRQHVRVEGLRATNTGRVEVLLAGGTPKEWRDLAHAIFLAECERADGKVGRRSLPRVRLIVDG